MRALLIAALALSACNDAAVCRPNTLFLRLGVNDTVRAADQIAITIAVAGVNRQAAIDYHGGDGIQVDFADGDYVAGTVVDIRVDALSNGLVVATVSIPAYTLPVGCGQVTIDFGGNSDGGSDAAAMKPNGTTCGAAGECTSGYCVDGVCCEAGCNGQCEACDVSGYTGQCVGVGNGSPHGQRAACAGANGCDGSCAAPVRTVCTYPGAEKQCRAQSCAAGIKQLRAVCDGSGTCVLPADFTCPNGACQADDCLGACTKDADCSSLPYCNLPEGVCLATKDEGTTCSMNSECTSGFCVDGVCCNSACNQQCQVCTATPGQCRTVTSGAPVAPRPACDGSGSCGGTCDGTYPDKCDYPGGSQPCGFASCANGIRTAAASCNGAGTCPTSTPTPCPSNQCSGTDCLPSCGGNDALCGANRWCDPGNVCHDKKGNGAGCGTAHECANGNCVGGICCASACSGTTPACTADGAGCFCPCSGTTPTCTATGACACTAGSCPGGQVCAGTVCCTPSCVGKKCGSDGCIGSCGTCTGTHMACFDGQCECTTCSE